MLWILGIVAIASAITLLAARTVQEPRTALKICFAVICLLLVMAWLSVVAFKKDPFSLESCGIKRTGGWIQCVAMFPLVYYNAVWFSFLRRQNTKGEAGCLILIPAILMIICIDGFTSGFFGLTLPRVNDAGQEVLPPGLFWQDRGVYIGFTIVEYIPIWSLLLPSRRKKEVNDAEVAVATEG